jgi:hypothetical protein
MKIHRAIIYISVSLPWLLQNILELCAYIPNASLKKRKIEKQLNDKTVLV